MINIIHGNAFELMDDIPDKSIDLVLTDPPYGMSFQSGHRKQKHKKIENDDNLDWLPMWIEKLKRVCKQDSHLYVFCSWHKVDVFKAEFEKQFKVKNIIIWEKNNTGMGDLEGDFAPKYEMCLFINNGKKLKGRRDSNIIKAKKTDNEHHPTQKPINLMEYFIEKSTNTGDMVLDCFSGSGSTAIAAHNTGRNFIGYEIEEEYFDISIKRLAHHQSQLTMF